MEDTAPQIADREEVLLIEERRGKPGSGLIAPGTSPDGTTAYFSVNGQSSSFNLTMKTNERVRLRFEIDAPAELMGAFNELLASPTSPAGAAPDA